MSALCGVQVLGSTPPGSFTLPTPSPAARSNGGNSKRTSLVSFRSGLSDYDGPGSLKGGLSRSQTAESASLSRSSLGARRTLSSEGSGAASSAAAAGFGYVSASSSSVSARPLHSTPSIPKSAQFVKIEGFAAAGDSPASSAPPSAPASPQQQRTLSSLLSRQLSTDRLPVLGSSGGSMTSSLGAAGSTGSPYADSLPAGFDDPLVGLAARLEQTVRVAPVPRPAPLPRSRSSIPDNLLQQLQNAHSVFCEPVCVRAFGIARAAHDGRYRVSGEPAFVHCVEVARILAELGADEGTVSAALLHDALDKTLLVEAQLRPMLGDDRVAELVKQVAHLGDVSSKYRSCPATSPEGQAATASSLVGMLVAMGANHALLVKLADRLHDMRTLSALPAAKRNRLAQETVDVWAPLANRLGVWSLKAQLEDLAFKQLYPGQYAELRARLEQVQSADVLVGLMDKMRSEMQRQTISYHDLSGRPKHLWGVFKKMAAKGYSLGRISDVRGLRIIVDTKADCYRALRAVETVWKGVGPTKDYIRNPKDNGYRSLHTVVRGEDGHDIEVQIRTAKMHYFAEYGADAAHWQYKERTYAATASIDEDTSAALAAAPPGAASAPKGNASGAAREANWAKFVLSQQVHDQKYRPSGSPTQDHSLASIVGLAASLGVQPSSSSGEEDSPGGSPPRDARFAAYLERSGQKLEPPPAERVVVAVVHEGGLTVEELPAGTTLLGLVQQRRLGLRTTQVLVNKQVESNPSAVLHTGDIVDLYSSAAEPAVSPLLLSPRGAASPAPPATVLASRQAGRLPTMVQPGPAGSGKPPMGAGRSNVVPLGALKVGRLRANGSSS
ncbi:hypothetical protein D9Q98_003020 [Chlorella vulgaris]|uniref:GTP diphosphokinase n=1 Tax=Chlorella vulgaris TaxID=3077 RepID=A0A9D4TV00_CHLVU|nr:hypothetical protein D9Q98_003020 [Chlorella vulgaris]